ncbi:MAG: IS481 family transposase, partial [Actinomycetota bacterium]|nr:IS481 family transposase [Actinomycetota bacterium]
PAWIHEYNHHRPHSAIGKHSPITRLNNLAGHHN